MRKLFFYLSILICLFITDQAIAQFTVGVSAGLTKAWENYGDVETPEDAELHIFGKYASLKVYKELNNNFQLGLEPGVTQKGARCVPGFEVFESDTYLYLNYVDLPFMLKYNLPLVKDFLSVQGKGGYGASFLRKAYRGTLPFDSDEDIKDIDFREITLGKPFTETGQFARFEHSLYSGISLSVNLGNNQFLFETDYIFGLSNAPESPLLKTEHLNGKLVIIIGFEIMGKDQNDLR